MKRLIFIVFAAIALFLSSCEYREYASADYPENTVYQPLAKELVYKIDQKTPPSGSIMTPGQPLQYEINEEEGLLIVHLGVVQSGISLKECVVEIYTDDSVVAEMIINKTLPVGTMPLNDSMYTIPEKVNMSSEKAGTAFDMEIDLNSLKQFYPSKKVAVAVSIDSKDVKVNPDMDTVVIMIDTAVILK